MSAYASSTLTLGRVTRTVDASQWAKELRSAAIEGRKNILLDTTLGNGDSAVALIKDLQAKDYEVEIRGVVAHRQESELGVDGRLSGKPDDEGYGRYIPEDVRRARPARRSTCRNIVCLRWQRRWHRKR